LLDPYGLHLDWQVIHEAGQSSSIEIFLNFPIADINRNVLWRNPDKVDPRQARRMTRFWGDESWRESLYPPENTLFGEIQKKTNNETVARVFGERLRATAGFKYVPEPMPMRNSKKAVVYYLFFASHKPVAAHIVTSIFGKYRDRGL